MGLFSFFKKDNSDKSSKEQVIETDRKDYDLGFFSIDIPKSWITFKENKRFKANNVRKDIELSVNVKQLNINFSSNQEINHQQILEQILSPLMDRFVNEGGYLEQEDRKYSNEFAYCSFLVDNRENHFHLWSIKEKEGEYLLYDQILKQSGNWNANTKQLVFEIFDSLKEN